MSIVAPSKPTGLLKLTFTLPRYLYRWYLGWVLRQRCFIEVQVGRLRYTPHQRLLEAQEILHVLEEYQRTPPLVVSSVYAPHGVCL